MIALIILPARNKKPKMLPDKVKSRGEMFLIKFKSIRIRWPILDPKKP